MAASLLAQAALAGAVALLPSPAPLPQVDVQLLPPVSSRRPGPIAAPGPPPPPAHAPRSKRATRPATAKLPPAPLVAPQVVPDRPPEPGPPEPEEESAGEEGGVVGGVPGGAGDGVVGGVPGGGGSGAMVARAPVPARPADLAMVRERIARTLAYPPRARKLGWQGTVALTFVLRADGRIRELRMARSSGYPVLDEAALSAVERAVPFPPPGMDVRIELPVTFRLR